MTCLEQFLGKGVPLHVRVHNLMLVMSCPGISGLRLSRSLGPTAVQAIYDELRVLLFSFP